jgi:PAT family acetyl-CoA transporter-like MFS transporter 1
VGQTAGYFMGYVFFMALESYGLVTLPGFLQFWASVFMITTTLVAVLKSERGAGEVESDEPDLGVVQTYKVLLDILKLTVMPTTIAMLLTSKVGFAAADAVTGLKLVEAGVPKDKLAMLAIPMMPLQIVLPWIISRYTAGPRPMDVWRRAIPARLLLCLVMAGLVWVTPSFRQEDGAFPLHYYGLVVFIYGIYQVGPGWAGGAVAFPQVTLYSMFVSVMAFFAKVSDPAVGGTYMTLLNTVTNLGGNWPSTLALWAVDPLTTKLCQVEGVAADTHSAPPGRERH